MQFLDGSASGPNGRESRTARSSEQDPVDGDQASGRGSLMARYRGTPQPEPAAEDRTPPGGDRPGAPGTPPAGSGGDSPWRQSGWTSAPPVLPAPSAPATPATPATPPSSTTPPSASPSPAPPSPAPPSPAPPSPAAPGSSPSSAAPASPAPAADRPTAFTTPAVERPAAERPADKPADKPGMAVQEPAGKPFDVAPAEDEPAGRSAPAARPTGGLLSAERSAEFRRRWRELQSDFVDDPQQAVRDAGDLSLEILRALSGTIADAERVDRWRAEDGTSGTEDLRVALRQYRTLVDRLLQL